MLLSGAVVSLVCMIDGFFFWSTPPSETSLGRCQGRAAMISTAVSVSPFHHIIINSTLKSCNSQNGSHLGLQYGGDWSRICVLSKETDQAAEYSIF
ncbi:hypothetical protein YC2023_115614 [Brassica napus]